MTTFTSFARTVSCDLDDATQFATLHTVGVVHGQPAGTPIATLQRARVLGHRSPRWQLFNTNGELLRSWRYSPDYQSLVDSAACVLAAYQPAPRQCRHCDRPRDGRL